MTETSLLPSRIPATGGGPGRRPHVGTPAEPKIKKIRARRKTSRADAAPPPAQPDVMESFAETRDGRTLDEVMAAERPLDAPAATLARVSEFVMTRPLGAHGVARMGSFGRPRRPHVAILGFTDHRKLAPFTDPTFEVWGLNELYRYMPPAQFHRWFEIHDRAYFEQHDPEHLKALAQLPMPVYMQTAHADIPNAIPLPKAEIERVAGEYMTSSIAWMLGLAILEGFRKIHVYGVDMAQDTEYKEQRPGCEYLIGLARGMGIEVYVPPTSDLMKSVGQYAFGGGGEFSLKIVERMEWLHRERNAILARTNQLEAEYAQKAGGLKAEYETRKAEFLRNVHQLEGAIDDNVYWKRSWAVGGSNAPGAAAPHPDRGEPTLEQPPAGDNNNGRLLMPTREQQLAAAGQG